MTIPDEIQPNLADLKQYQADNIDIPLDAWALVQLRTQPDVLVGIARWFWPQFVAYRGGVFFADGGQPPSNADEWFAYFAARNGTIKDVEQMLNHRHVGEDLLYGFAANYSYQTIAFLAHVLRHTWAAALKLVFSDRSVEFALWPQGEDDTPYDVVITFWTTETP